MSLPAKKGMVVGVDPTYLQEGYCQIIFTGIDKLLGEKIHASKGLHLGGGGALIPKFLQYNYENIEQTIVEKSESVIIHCERYFNWRKDIKSFNVIRADALEFIRHQSL